VVSNLAGTVTSNIATLTVDAPMAPSITTQPVSQTVVAGETATFFVVATGAEPLGYQWKKKGKPIKGATSASYTTPATTAADNGSEFTVVVSNSGGSVTSGAATLTVNVPVAPSITTQPVSQTVVAGETATFFVVATGTDPLSYQWNQNGASIAGATSAYYTTPATTAADNGSELTVVVSNPGGTVTSNAVALTVTIPGPVSPAISSVNFGNVDIGSSSAVQVALINSGTASVAISGVAIAGPGFGTEGLSVGQILLAGQTAPITVTFAPAATETFAGSVTVTSNAVNSPTAIPLSGTGTEADSHSAELSWTASASFVVGYNVYQAVSPGGPYSIRNSSPVATTRYLDLTVQPGQTYYYVVTAVDSNNVESEYSTEVPATIPTP
jgi:hypothetical protein